jgi:hypothetical protein
LKEDLEDAAKAAAEAAAEQAALDIAAKAFCRVAVPALLAPLELLEDLIPIVGEILDVIEIAATPAIIQGCVKGIEKEGKAEFKAFGKERTLRYVPNCCKLLFLPRVSVVHLYHNFVLTISTHSMAKPTEKPTTVPDRPATKTGDTPAKTGMHFQSQCPRCACAILGVRSGDLLLTSKLL